MKLVNQRTVSRVCRVTPQTVKNWEKRGLLRRVQTPRPGAWYNEADVLPFLLEELVLAQPATPGIPTPKSAEPAKA